MTVDYYDRISDVCLVYRKERWLRVTTGNVALRTALMDAMRFSQLMKDGKRYYYETVDRFEVRRARGIPSLICKAGFYELITQLVEDYGVELIVVDAATATRLEHPANVSYMPLKVPKSDWDSLRDWQRTAVKVFNTFIDGRIGVATGGGKSTFIKYLCKFLPTQKILVTAKGKGLVDDLHRAISSACANVGIHRSGRVDPVGRILVCSVGCLHHHRDTLWDLAIGDEIHEHVTPDALTALGTVRAHRMYGFSANLRDRVDNADAWAEAIYGPIRLIRSYADVESDGDVVPIRVDWLDLEHLNVSSKYKQPTKRARELIWMNTRRNKAFVARAQTYIDRGLQTLFLVDTTEHALRLSKLIDVPVAVTAPSPASYRKFVEAGVIEDGYQFLTSKQVSAVQQKFARGEIRVMIANKVWHTGKDFPSLDVLARLDANSTEIGSTQIPGRLSRTSPGKSVGVLIDSRDKFDAGMEARAGKRRRSYRAKGWFDVETEV